MSGTRWKTKLTVAAVGGLCVLLAACGPAVSGSGSLSSVGSAEPAAAQSSAAPATSSAVPTSTSSAASPAATTAAPVPTTTAAATTSAPAKAGSTISASVGKDSIRYGDQGAFAISVQASGAAAGTDLTGHVTVLDGAEVVAEGDTDAAGAASLSVYNRATPGPKTYTASYSGTTTVDASVAQFVVQTTQTNADISINWTDGLRPGSDATIDVGVVGTPDNPTGNVTVTYDGNQIASGPVDANGKINGTVNAVVAGDHTIAVSYAGDDRFEANTSSATLSVKEPVTNPNAAGAAAAQAANPCPAAAAACVDLSNEQAWLQSGGQITYGPVPITSGAAGSRTGAGMFSVFWRDKDHLSSIFNNAPMPNSVFFDGGIAFHQGSLSDQSNGCIHLSWDASETFFDTLSVGDAVYVWGAAPY